MRQLDSYVARNVLMATMVVMIVIVGLDAIFTLVDELDNLKGDYQLLDALLFSGLRLPRRIYEYMPMACLIGCLAGLGSMAANSELTVMRAAGVSINRIVFAVLKPMAVLMLISLFLGEYAVPSLERIAQAQKAVAQGATEALSNKGKGFWHREGDTFMRFNAVEPGGVLHGITRYEFNEENELKQVVYAQRALYQRAYWQMENIVTTIISDDVVTQETQASGRWDTELTPEKLSVVTVSPRDMSMTTLYYYSQYLDQQGLNSDQYMLSFWRKITQPLSTFSLVILGISFIFGPLRSVTPGYRIFSGIVVGMIYKYAEELLSPASIVLGFEPIMASVIPISGSLILGLLLMRKAA
ncbi:LPS export ABC transporter permease LptG [Oleispira antarctica]|uniref:LPS export ABC transporter permease LptG n=1 Tax=Oleispira antarctica TaxID=188908 RepID=A0A1Y5HZ26_OLEAN|nr:LPS export ABC transporter permease LptG [Oleispira antarctica]